MAAGSTGSTYLTPELIETGRVLTKRCKLADRVALRVGNALELPYSEQTFDVIWCQNVAMNIADKAGLFAGVYRRAVHIDGIFSRAGWRHHFPGALGL